jgi:ABC-type branched-subunit amino acid transport system ATPase component
LAVKNTILAVEQLVSGYRADMDIIHNVSMKFNEGEIISVIGPNGAGKSTLFKTIYGFVEARKGRIIFNDQEITNLPPAQILEIGISFLPQGKNLFANMSVHENLEMGGYIRRDSNIKEDIEKVYKKFPILDEKKKELARNLSGGQQQLLQLGRALLLSPVVLMLDEPSLGLSPIMLRQIFTEILRIRDMGVTILMIEQNAASALKISDYAYVLELGRNRFEGTGEYILNNPRVKKLYLGGK